MNLGSLIWLVTNMLDSRTLEQKRHWLSWAVISHLTVWLLMVCLPTGLKFLAFFMFIPPCLRVYGGNGILMEMKMEIEPLKVMRRKIYSTVGTIFFKKRTGCVTGSVQLTTLSKREEKLWIKWKNLGVWLRVHYLINSGVGCELFENLQRWWEQSQWSFCCKLWVVPYLSAAFESTEHHGGCPW